HLRKIPARQTALATVADSFLSLLASPDHPSAPSLRGVFLPALLGSDARPRDPSQLAALDSQLAGLFAQPPQIVALQTVPSQDAVDKAWRDFPREMAERVFVAYPLHTEMERAKEENEKEELANLSMLVIATLAHELAQWIWVKMRGYRPIDPYSDTASLHTTTTTHSVTSSIHSQGSLLAPHRHKDDVGTRAVLALLGCDFELWTYSIGSRELVKRRYPTRRSPVLTPPVVYFLIGDTPAIRDCTSLPPTVSGMVPPHRDGDSMHAITSVLAPSGLAKMHGSCVVGQQSPQGGAQDQLEHGVKVSLDGTQRDDDGDEKVFDSIYSGL
ncbi:uncharacterized protein JCM10292_001385, partial [Rhodotorula paludigena]|uniref:uncharacterized protein n=1 Tax=Rhodotorula paludigena TaxID=86838 RepID=UPI003175A2B9